MDKYEHLKNLVKVGSEDGKWGYSYENGEFFTPIKYDYCRVFCYGFAVVGIDGKYGYINSEGKEITPIKYDYCSYFDHEYFAIVKLNNKSGYINSKGTEITPIKYDKCYPFYKEWAITRLNGVYKFVNKDGQEIECNVKKIRRFENKDMVLFVYYNKEYNITHFTNFYYYKDLEEFKSYIESSFNSEKNKKYYDQYMKIIKEYEQ